MERVTLYKVVKEEVTTARRDSIEVQHMGFTDCFVKNSGDLVYGLCEIERIEIEEVRNNHSHFLYGVSRDVKDLLLNIRDPEKFERLDSEVKRYRHMTDAMTSKSRALEGMIKTTESANFLTRLKWLFSGVKVYKG